MERERGCKSGERERGQEWIERGGREGRERDGGEWSERGEKRSESEREKGARKRWGESVVRESGER